ncbi:uncharacterized protein BX663DRAFT_510520 [Cokeromyces recurvatus]|uniref:uncharacterized protein n=1 Tax=Cokeromyces recurvatus TaxID=90255 RepID=UPI00221F8E93|nr:uncharacterized protein BX663DRAFT_510520 [Cokeromyces recurvatus]KAI7902797.1 hypothetical protein BX663DRAFT_510520 [Cokeromyces recurvatus]
MRLNTFICLFASIYVTTAQLTAPTRNYNVTSPVTNGPYVVGQILPCTYRLFPDVDSSALILQIDLESTSMGAVSTMNATTMPIAISADVAKTDAFVKREGNTTYYEHSINFSIPSSVKPGNYHVIFLDKSTNTKLPIPIEIRPAAVSTFTGTRTSTIGTPGQSQSPGSIFAQGGASSNTPTMITTLLALIGVAFVAFLL